MTELGQLQRYYHSFRDLGVQLVAVCVDSPEQNSRLRRRLSAEIEFLSDPECRLIDQLNIRQPRRQPGERGLAIPSQFLVDAKGIIRWVYLPDTWRKRVPPRGVLQAISDHLNSPSENPGP